jgi:hypothetical protein
MKESSVSWRGLLIVGIAVTALGIIYRVAKIQRNSPPALNSTPASPAKQSSEHENSEPREVSPSQFLSNSQLPAVVQSTARLSSSVEPPVARTEPTPYTRQLVASLTNLDLSHGPITREQAEQWKQGLQTLTAQGVAAVPAIREFLEKNLELNFSGIDGGQLLGQASLRTALLDALQQIGGPEALDVMLQTLRTTALPSEVALLAQQLEQLSPGQYRQETLNAVNEILDVAAKGELHGWDVGPLFQVLGNYGDAATVSTLEKLQAQWKYYATISLAGLQGGEGVSTLIHQVQDPATSHDFAFQMLAQVAAQYPEAGAALLEQVQRNQIPDTAWRKIVSGLAGDQYQIGAPPSDAGPGAASAPGLKTYHIESGNQNFYSLPVTAEGQAGPRIALIDQLLGATSNPAAIQALQNARTALSGLRSQ